ncbi:MAG: DUF488 domain-containing protein [Solirubrobacterales bacterium]|nr:DUF488 domain-containing protein [Solirubrobacterales bacterium]
MAEQVSRTIYTVGHSTRSEDEFLALLASAGVSAVADVRAVPASRRNPQYTLDALRAWLPDAGIRYVHFRALGGRRTPLSDSRNDGWRERAFQGYADHMASPEFGRAIEQLEHLAGHQPTSVMCAETLWWRCHRRLIADALTVRGWRVEHLGVGGKPTIHELPPFAVVKDGTLSYPSAQPRLL